MLNISLEKSVLEAFKAMCQERPDQLVYVMVDQQGQDQVPLTYAQLDEQSEQLAVRLLQAGHRRGERAVQLYHSSADFVIALVACLKLGIASVPLAVPRLRSESDVALFVTVTNLAEANLILSHHPYADENTITRLNEALAGTPCANLPWYITNDGQPVDGTASYELPEATDIALIQYTSGSTSTPKGVVINYGSLAHQLQISGESINLSPDARAVMWLPHFHDFGLICGILNAVYGNGVMYMLDPAAFIMRPAVWFEVMSRVGCTHTGAPTFAYELAVARTTEEQRLAWDLSSIQTMMCAAEPISVQVVQNFLSAFAISGLNPQAFCPAYGLAEQSPGVSANGRTILHADRDAFLTQQAIVLHETPDEPATISLISSGFPIREVELFIVDPETRQLLPDGHIGEIWIRSNNMASGYYKNEEATRYTFQATLAGETQPFYLRTGDMGFLYQQEIFITGRLKDMIIVRGRNLYPNDLEQAVLKISEKIQQAAAFAIPDPADPVQEQLAIALELTTRRLEATEQVRLIQAVRAKIAQDFRVECHTVILLPRRTLSLTTSGKIQRQANRTAFLQGVWQDVAFKLDSLN